MSRRAQISGIKSEGGLLPIDILTRIQSLDRNLEGTNPETYHLGPTERIGEAVNRSWSRLTSLWTSFQQALAKESESSFATKLTRDSWLLQLFQELGYGWLTPSSAFEIEGKSFPISHCWHCSPIHLLGTRIDIDRPHVTLEETSRSRPHGMVQEFLNLSDDHLWGFLSNGLILRVLRDHHSLTRQAYLDFDLEAIMNGEQYSEFMLLWMICHQSRVEAKKPEECWLEKWFTISKEEGIRALDKLRGGVEHAIEALGTGFLAHRANSKLQTALKTGALDSQDYFRQLLRLVYRVIFLFAAEERDLLIDPDADETARDRYERFYSARRLRELAEKRRGGQHSDLWRGLRLVMDKLFNGEPQLALPALGSRLWSESACPWLMESDCSNEHILEAIRCLSSIQEGKVRYPVNWRNIGADELGSIYEGLLELHPELNREAGTFALDTATGHERKTTGSYYTPSSLVDCLLDSALDPVLDEAAKKPDPETAILNLKVCDPACGSGHFLVAAARRIAKRLAAIRSGDEEPSPGDVQKALRDVVGRCIYGVDLNPMAVELCKVSLWMEALEPGRPLSFLDSHIQMGNSLLGATPALMDRGIPDEAFKPIEGDDKKVATRLKKQNKDERKGQGSFFDQLVEDSGDDLEVVVSKISDIESSSDHDIEAVRKKASDWGRLTRSPEFRGELFRADAWCSAFVWPKQTQEDEASAITESLFRRLQKDTSVTSQHSRKTVRSLSKQYRFFHWHLMFPQVFKGASEDIEESTTTGWLGGFDIVLGNPPWEKLKLHEKEWFSTRAPDVAAVKNASARKKAIAKIETEDPILWKSWISALRAADGFSHFVRNNGFYPLCGRGDINTYAIFAELNRSLVNPIGRVGCIVPSGIATDATTQYFFSELMISHSLVSLFAFWEIRRIFIDTDSRDSFVLLTLTADRSAFKAEFAFELRTINDLNDHSKKFVLSDTDVSLLNPNTKTCPVFRSRRDAEITKAIYRQVPVLWKEDDPNGNSWELSFKRMLDMANDSGLFRTKDQLEEQEWLLDGNIFVRDGQRMLPLYEAKMVHHYDHRFGDYDDKPVNSQSTALPDVPIERLQKPNYSIVTRYWVSESEVEKRLEDRWDRGWLLGWRDICRATDMRTVIAGIVPRVGVGNKFILMLTKQKKINISILIANFSSFIFDYSSRQKIGGTSLNYFILKQLPVLPPDVYDELCAWNAEKTIGEWIRTRVLELTYTAWDLEAFGRDIGYEGPPFRWDTARRFKLRAELDAAFFHLYGIKRDDVDYIMETFPIVKRKDEAAHGNYRTKLAILDIYDSMQKAIETGVAYQTILDPPAADPSVAHPPKEEKIAFPQKVAAINIQDLPSLPDEEWKRYTPNPQYDPGVVLAAILKAAGGPISIRNVRLSAIMCLEPHLLIPSLTPDETRQWQRLVGNEAKERKGVIEFVPTIDHSWGDAVTHLRGNGDLIEDLGAKTWTPGPEIARHITEGWPDGRAQMVLSVVHRLGVETVVNHVREENQEAVRSWVDDRAA